MYVSLASLPWLSTAVILAGATTFPIAAQAAGALAPSGASSSSKAAAGLALARQAPKSRSQAAAPPHCAIDQAQSYLDRLYQADPAHARHAQAAAAASDAHFRQRSSSNFTPRGEEYVVPIVFHIIHDEGVENLPDSRIDDAMKIINADFQGANTDKKDIIPEFADLFANAGVTFRLADLDPDGNPTTGITRDRSGMTLSGHGSNPKVKRINTWPRNKYLNIWIVRSSDGGNGSAWAYYPNQVDHESVADLDGVIMSHWCVGEETEGYERILTHEIGHWLNLHHSWSPFLAVGSDAACDEDDEVEDTPNCTGFWGGCELDRESCGTLDNIQNYMDYSTCSAMFTLGQKERMVAAMTSTIGERDQIWTKQTHDQVFVEDGVKRVIFDRYRLDESYSNDGTFTTQVGIQLDGEKFSANSGEMESGVHYKVEGVPEGLEFKLKFTGKVKAVLEVQGATSAHAVADNSSISIEFLDAALDGGKASTLLNATQALQLQFRDAYECIVRTPDTPIYLDDVQGWSPFKFDFGADALGLWRSGSGDLFETYGQEGLAADTTRQLVPLADGDEIGPDSATWTRPGSAFEEQLVIRSEKFTDWEGKTAYIGLRFAGPQGGLPIYTWIKTKVEADRVEVLEFGYNPAPGGNILAGTAECGAPGVETAEDDPVEVEDTTGGTDTGDEVATTGVPEQPPQTSNDTSNATTAVDDSVTDRDSTTQGDPTTAETLGCGCQTTNNQSTPIVLAMVGLGLLGFRRKRMNRVELSS